MISFLRTSAFGERHFLENGDELRKKGSSGEEILV